MSTAPKVTMLSTIYLALFATAQAGEAKTHTALANSNRCEYSIKMGGTMDGVNTRSPIGYAAWTQKFDPNISVRIENVGDVDVVNPWVFVNGKRNWRTVQDIVAEATAGRKTAKERAIGIWQFEIGRRFHWTTLDVEDNDPVKVFNVYGYTLCGNDAHVISDLWRAAGFKVRRGFPQGHCTAEVLYDSRYHHLDGDENIICLLRDNETIASEADIVRDHDLMKRTHTYGILAGDNRKTDEFSASLCVYEGHREGEHRSHIGHTMHFTLRPREALEWRWDNIGRLHSNWQGCKAGQEVMDRVCNGRMFYAPKLPEISKQNGTVWQIRSPYVIVGGKIKGTFTRPSQEAVCKLAISFDQKKWREVFAAEVGEAEKEIDLSEVLGPTGPARYAYFVKLESAGNGGVKSIALESVLQMAPLSLPALELGENKVTYVSETRAAHGVRITHTWRESSASRAPAAPAQALFPADKAKVEGTAIAFKWQPAVDPDGHAVTDYHFQLSSRSDMLWHLSPNFNKLISRTTDRGKAQYTLPYKGLLNPGRTYYWRVRAQDDRGVWSKWSNVWSFTPQGPGVPTGARFARPDREKRTVALTWRADSTGRPPVKYRVYGSDEKGFTASDEPYELVYQSIQQQAKVQGRRDMKRMPANFACETAGTKLTVLGPDLEFPNANKAYYRVVAVDEHGVESGPSDYAEMPRPFIYTRPPAEAHVGKRWDYQVRAISSTGDLRSRTFVPGKYVYNAGFWDKDTVRFHLHLAAKWLKVDEATGSITGTPGPGDVGKHAFLVYADIPKVGCESQTIELEVRPR